MENLTPLSIELRQCLACRRDAPISFFSKGNNACDCCAEGAPPLPEWIDAKLAKCAARVVCECGAVVAPTSISKHRQTVVHKRIVARLSERDPSFAAEVEAKEMARAEAVRVKAERVRANAAATRVIQEGARTSRELMPPPQPLTPEEMALRERLRIRKEQCRIAAGLPAVKPPKSTTYVCPDCGSSIANKRDNIKIHRRAKKHLIALKNAIVFAP